jgi:hypothetical protein
MDEGEGQLYYISEEFDEAVDQKLIDLRARLID